MRKLSNSSTTGDIYHYPTDCAISENTQLSAAVPLVCQVYTELSPINISVKNHTLLLLIPCMLVQNNDVILCNHYIES